TPEERADFLREASDASALRGHPNIIPIYHVGIHDNHPYFTMELAAGTLAGRIAQLQDQPRQVAELMVQVAGAVEFAHSSGILHRDLKPANVLLTEQGVPKVADFGLAQRLLVLDAPATSSQPTDVPQKQLQPVEDTVSYAGRTQTNRVSVAGTPNYM